MNSGKYDFPRQTIFLLQNNWVIFLTHNMKQRKKKIKKNQNA
jgi:hypothetical protein